MSAAKLATFKAAFSQPQRHFNNAGLCPLSRPAAEALGYWTKRFYEEGYACDQDYADGVEAVRKSLGSLLGVAAERLAFIPSTAYGVCQVAFSLDLQPGDEVVSVDQEYGSHLYPWREACRRRGAVLKLAASGPGLSVDHAALAALIGAKTRVVAVSWVQYQTGALLDLQRLQARCQEFDALLCVDAMQGVGLFSLNADELGVDAVYGGSHKWLASPVGAGYLGLSDRLFRRLQPLVIGAQTYGTCDDPTSDDCQVKTGASRLEPGAKASLEILALGASVGLIQATGVEVIGAELTRLARRLRQGLRAKGYRLICPHSGSDDAASDEAQRGGIVVCQPTAKTRWPTLEALRGALAAAGIYVPLRGGGVRLSVHAFHDDQDIEAVLAAF